MAANRCNCVQARWRRSELKDPEPKQPLIGNHTKAGDGSVCWGAPYVPFRHRDVVKTHISHQSECIRAAANGYFQHELNYLLVMGDLVT